MKVIRARIETQCPLCPRRVRKGQRVALHFETRWWAHVDCILKPKDDKEFVLKNLLQTYTPATKIEKPKSDGY